MRQRPAIDQTTCELFVLLFVGPQANWFLPASGGGVCQPRGDKNKTNCSVNRAVVAAVKCRRAAIQTAKVLIR